MTKIHRLRVAILGPLVALAAACSDAIGPDQHPSAGSAFAARGTGSYPADGKGGHPAYRHEEEFTSFTIQPNRDDRFTIGGTHVLIVPAHAICDPERSSYGMGTWNDPCVRLDRPIKVTAVTWRDAFGLPRIQFSPELRFSPDRIVTLWMKDKAVKSGGDFAILYCPTEAYGGCVDESISDPSLKSFVIQKSGTVFRRIKHFSIYNLAAESWHPVDGAYDSYDNSGSSGNSGNSGSSY